MSTRLRKVESFNTDVVDNREILRVLTSFRNGNFSVRMPVDSTGIAGKIYDALNDVIGSNERLAKELERVSNLVGKEGKINHRASMPGATGSWAACIDSVNMLTTDLIQPTVDVSRVIGAIAQGDLSQRMALEIEGNPFRGVFLQTVKTVNTMVDQLSNFTSEVIRVAREVGTEGRLGGQAQVKDIGGTWKDLTDSVNFMASNLTNQVRNIAAVTTAVAGGDPSKKITVDARGEILELKDTINIMVDQLNSFASEVTRVAREVGTEGRLGGQADVRGVGGTWKDLTDSVNSMASNLTAQVRNIAEVTTAVALGDLSKKITVDVRGEILNLKSTINTMVDQLNSFASEVTRVAREVGTDGRLGGQAEVRGVGGTWKDLTDSVNSMASNLTAQVRNIAEVTTSVAKGDLSKKITVDVRGEILELKNTINTMVDQLNSFASEVTRVAREVGTEGRLGGQAQVGGVGGTWKDLTDSVNFMASNLTNQVRNIAAVTTAVATGDLSKKITVDVRGEILELKNTVNIMVDQLNSFASEVTRVAREVGTEGKLGGQADVKGVAGTWKDLTDGVNSMASNLTNQVRGISKVVKEVASGNLKRKLVLEVKDEIADFADTINEMIDTLATFAEQVTTVAREVGTEGKLGGQANVPGATGTWRDLTDNVNRLAANLTNQVRAIAEVATAVTKWDLSRSIKVEAAGEVAALKDNLNEMIRNLKDTTEKSAAQDWLKTNLAKFTRLVQGQRDLLAVSKLVLSELAPLVSMQHGVFYLKEQTDGEPEFRLLASYAFKERKTLSNRFRLGEGLVGQAGFERQRILLTEAPSDYIQISSGLGEAKPLNIVLLPVLFEGEVKAVIELASFSRFTDIHLTFLDQLSEIIGIMLNTITATMRTEDLLKKSQALAAELQSRQAELTATNSRLQEQAKSLSESEEALKFQKEELKQTNDALEDKAQLLAKQNREVESKNAEIERARRSLEEKAEQLALSSKYKSQFLANMSHELRTPLNSMLILAKLLLDNPQQNLSPKQIEYAQTIGASGSDLLALINEILDLSKIEAGVMQIEVSSVFISEIENYIDQTFRHVAESKSLGFSIEIAADIPQVIETDAQRLRQVLKNLLSNAFKFTEHGRITVKIDKATEGWDAGHPILSQANAVVAFSVIDTGIGIAPDKHQLIFEAFQQAEGGTGRRFGGTGLGLSISRELARMLGGEIRLISSPGRGSTFTLYLPQSYPRSAADLGPDAKRMEAAVGGTKVTQAPPKHSHPSTPQFAMPDSRVKDDRAAIGPNDSVAVIIEDDVAFARILLDVARSNDFKGIVALEGEEGINAVQEWKPNAIVLDLHLPGMDGWSILDHLKHNPTTRHIPVHIISVDDERAHCLGMGALGYLRKPVTYEQIVQAFSKLKAFAHRSERNLVVVENDLNRQRNIVESIGNGDVHTIAVTTGRAALEVLPSMHIDCMVMDIGLPDMTAFELIERIRKELKIDDLRIVLYTGRELTRREETELRSAAGTMIVKDVRSLDRLLDEATLFLHRVECNLPDEKREELASLHRSDPALEGKKILIIDDDIRNVFALSSLFELYKLRVFFAETGRAGIEILERTPDIDAAIVDVMMPGMDGLETIRAIRANPCFASLPLFALTAKAMKGDREACFEAGATDYIAKPADSDHLISLLRAHVSRQST